MTKKTYKNVEDALQALQNLNENDSDDDQSLYENDNDEVAEDDEIEIEEEEDDAIDDNHVEDNTNATTSSNVNSNAIANVNSNANENIVTAKSGMAWTELKENEYGTIRNKLQFKFRDGLLPHAEKQVETNSALSALKVIFT